MSSDLEDFAIRTMASNDALRAEIAELRAALPVKPVMAYSRSEFESLDAAARMAAVKRGASINDPAPPDRSPLAAPDEMPKVLLRSVWERWPASDQSRFIRGGGKLHDR